MTQLTPPPSRGPQWSWQGAVAVILALGVFVTVIMGTVGASWKLINHHTISPVVINLLTGTLSALVGAVATFLGRVAGITRDENDDAARAAQTTRGNPSMTETVDPDDNTVPEDQSPAVLAEGEVDDETDELSDEDRDPGLNEDEPSGHRDHAEVQPTDGPTAADVTGVTREPPDTSGQPHQEGGN